MIIFRAALKRVFQSKVRFLLIIIGPLIFIAMFSFNGHRAASVGVVDNDNSAASNGIYELLKGTDGIKVLKVTEEEMYDYTASYLVDYSIVIEKGFEDSMLKGDIEKIKEYYVEDKQKIYFLKNSIKNELDNYSILVKSVNADKTKFEATLKEYKVSSLDVYSNMKAVNRNIQARASFGFLVQFMLYMAVLTTGLILEDKSTGTYYRTFYGPISIKRYMSENLLAFFVTAVIQSVGIILLLRFVFKTYLGTAPFALIGLFILFSVVCIALGLFITTILKKPIQAYIAVAVLTTPLVMLGGCYWGFELMPEVMLKAGKFIPLTWVMRTVDALLDGSLTNNMLLTNCGILVLFAIIFFVTSLTKKVDISK